MLDEELGQGVVMIKRNGEIIYLNLEELEEILKNNENNNKNE
ncbi:hypothetical protein [Clostridium niameyense]|nr:hypothetical protein [Clostridium niameyense]